MQPFTFENALHFLGVRLTHMPSAHSMSAMQPFTSRLCTSYFRLSVFVCILIEYKKNALSCKQSMRSLLYSALIAYSFILANFAAWSDARHKHLFARGSKQTPLYDSSAKGTHPNRGARNKYHYSPQRRKKSAPLLSALFLL